MTTHPSPATEESSAPQVTIGSRVRVKVKGRKPLLGKVKPLDGNVIGTDEGDPRGYVFEVQIGSRFSWYRADELELLPDEEAPCEFVGHPIIDRALKDFAARLPEETPEHRLCVHCGHRGPVDHECAKETCQNCGMPLDEPPTVTRPKETPESLRAEADRLEGQSRSSGPRSPQDNHHHRLQQAAELRARADAMEGKFACPACCDTGSFRAQGQAPCPDCAQAPAPDQARPTKGGFTVKERKGAHCGFSVVHERGLYIANGMNEEEASLLADALNTHAATGLTPGQLAERLKDADDHSAKCERGSWEIGRQLAALTKERDALKAECQRIRKVADAHADTIREEGEAKIAAEDQRDALAEVVKGLIPTWRASRGSCWCSVARNIEEAGHEPACEAARQALAAIRK